MKSKIDFVNEKTGRSLIRMVTPLLIAMFLTMAYNLVDSLWVGNLLGENGYAALTDSTALILILNAIAMGAGNGVSILVAQLVGADQRQKTEGVIATVVFISACFAVGLTIMAEIFLPGILKMLRTPMEIRNDAYAYLSIYLLGYTAIYLYMQFTSVFRAFGDPIFQMKGMFFTTVFNAVIDPILIKRMGLTGAAWATVLSEVLCLVYAIWYHKRRKLFTMDFHRLKVAYGKELLKDVVPSALQQCMPAISSAVMLTLVSGFGVTTIAAYGVTSKLEVLLFYPAMAVNMALVAIVGKCVGAAFLDVCSRECGSRNSKNFLLYCECGVCMLYADQLFSRTDQWTGETGIFHAVVFHLLHCNSYPASHDSGAYLIRIERDLDSYFNQSYIGCCFSIFHCIQKLENS